MCCPSPLARIHTWIVVVFVCLQVCAMRTRIQTSIELQELASEANCEMPCIFCIPWSCSILLAAWLLAIIFLTVYVIATQWYTLHPLLCVFSVQFYFVFLP
jgi:hypothetical protein